RQRQGFYTASKSWHYPSLQMAAVLCRVSRDMGTLAQVCPTPAPLTEELAGTKGRMSRRLGSSSRRTFLRDHLSIGSQRRFETPPSCRPRLYYHGSRSS